MSDALRIATLGLIVEVSRTLLAIATLGLIDEDLQPKSKGDGGGSGKKLTWADIFPQMLEPVAPDTSFMDTVTLFLGFSMVNGEI